MPLNHRTVATIDCQLRETGTFKPLPVNWGRERSIPASNVEEHILDHVNLDVRKDI
jgi:hypothetical protein